MQFFSCNLVNFCVFFFMFFSSIDFLGQNKMALTHAFCDAPDDATLCDLLNKPLIYKNYAM